MRELNVGERTRLKETEKVYCEAPYSYSDKSVGFPEEEPRKYPVLTPEEHKAVKWLADGGFTRLKRINGIWEMAESEEAYLYLTSFMPTAKCLRDVAWITETPINLKELLEAQEGV